MPLRAASDNRSVMTGVPTFEILVPSPDQGVWISYPLVDACPGGEPQPTLGHLEGLVDLDAGAAAGGVLRRTSSWPGHATAAMPRLRSSMKRLRRRVTSSRE